MDYTLIINAVLVALVALVETFLVPYLRTKISAERRKELVEHTSIAVEAAEQIFGGKKGQEKKAYVLKYLDSIGIRFDTQTVDMAIEAAVLELTHSFIGE